MKKAHVIILSGQSNACGVANIPLLKGKISDERLQRLYDGFDSVLIDYWSHGVVNNGFKKVKLDDNVSSCDQPNKFGPELSLAEYLSKRIDEPIYIIKWSYGGASLDFDFVSPSGSKMCFGPASHGTPYGWCFEGLTSFVRTSIKKLEDLGLTPCIEAFMWMQGESDACNECIERYMDKFNLMIKDFKNSFSEYLDEKFTVVDAGICCKSMWPLAKEMNELKEKNAKDNGYIFLDTEKEGLRTDEEPYDCPDIAHYDCLSMLKLGEMFAEAYKEIIIK